MRQHNSYKYKVVIIVLNAFSEMGVGLIFMLIPQRSMGFIYLTFLYPDNN